MTASIAGPLHGTIGIVFDTVPTRSTHSVVRSLRALARQGKAFYIIALSRPGHWAADIGELSSHVLYVESGSKWTTRAAVVGSHAACFVRHPLRYVRAVASLLHTPNAATRDCFRVAGQVSDLAESLGIAHVHICTADKPMTMARIVDDLTRDSVGISIDSMPEIAH